MRNQTPPRLNKWPFFLGDVLLLGVTWLIWRRSVPLGLWEMTLIAVCVGGGAVLAVLPFVLEYRAATRLEEVDGLSAVVSRIQNLEAIAEQISAATGRWQDVQDGADKTLAAAREIAERMKAEVHGFTDFIRRANDSEKATLRLEVEKLRRAETEWVQVLVRTLDHIYALHVGAVRSGQPNLIEQLSNFQNACRDAARRVGLTPFIPNPTEPFDAERHQVLDGHGAPPEGAKVIETIASGYTFQGRLLRPALVKLNGNGNGNGEEKAP